MEAAIASTVCALVTLTVAFFLVDAPVSAAGGLRCACVCIGMLSSGPCVYARDASSSPRAKGAAGNGGPQPITR